MATRSGLPQTLTDDELDALLAMPNLAVPTGMRDRCMLELFCRCGTRVTETCGLLLRDIDWRDGEIRIRPEIAKGGKAAVLYLDAPTQALLERWKDERRHYAAGSKHLFVCIRQAERGQPLNRRRVHAMVQRRARKAGIDHPVWPHMLRHTYATRRLAQGFNLEEVRILMRHEDIRTTRIYLHVRDVELRDKVRRAGQPIGST